MFIQLCIHSLPLVFPCRCCVHCVLLCLCPVPLDNDMSLPPRKHAVGMVHPPPGGAGVGRGGGMVSRASGTPYIYLNLYTFIYIANSSNLHMEVINVDKNKG